MFHSFELNKPRSSVDKNLIQIENNENLYLFTIVNILDDLHNSLNFYLFCENIKFIR